MTKSKSQSDTKIGALITIIFFVSCGGCLKCINSGPQTDWDNDKVHQQRMQEKSAVDGCVREGQTRAWCEDRMDVLKRTGR